VIDGSPLQQPALLQLHAVERFIHHHAITTVKALNPASSGLANGKYVAPRKLAYTASIGEPQQPVRKQPAAASTP
jgi:hypothetical protein